MVYGAISLRKREGVSRKKWQKRHRGRGYSYKSDATKSAIFLRVTCFLNNPYAKLCLMLEVHNEDT